MVQEFSAAARLPVTCCALHFWPKAITGCTNAGRAAGQAQRPAPGPTVSCSSRATCLSWDTQGSVLSVAAVHWTLTCAQWLSGKHLDDHANRLAASPCAAGEQHWQQRQGKVERFSSRQQTGCPRNGSFNSTADAVQHTQLKMAPKSWQQQLEGSDEAFGSWRTAGAMLRRTHSSSG